MWSRDLLRVLQGAGKVAEQLAKTPVPDLATQSDRLAKHVGELARVAPHLFGAATAAPPAPSTTDVSQHQQQYTEAAPAAAAASVVDPVPVAFAQDAAIERELQTHAAASSAASKPRSAVPKDIAASLPPKEAFEALKTAETKATAPMEPKSPPVVAPPASAAVSVEAQQPSTEEPLYQTVQDVLRGNVKPSPSQPQSTSAPQSEPSRDWKEKHVPSSPLSRILGFGSLAAKLAVGTATEIVRSGGKQGTYSALISDSNVEKLAETLCTMRGAALKLGQMLSIQDENMIPPKLAVALDRVRQNAHVMPKAQLHQQLAAELGDNWREHFKEFDDVPIAAASIGQVHRATLLSGERVAIKIQYPGVANSIESDLLNLKRLVTYTNILPKGLYIDEIIRVGQQELTEECNYVAEADNQERFRQLIQESGMDGAYVVPRVHREFSTARVLTTELISGVAIDKAMNLSQNVRNSIARRILELTIRELFDWRFMQTDPNWSNFMYNSATDKIGLVDFGAAREYDKSFVDPYFNIVWGAANRDEELMMEYSLKLKFLTGDESPAMMRAHMAAGMVVGEPFCTHEPFDFHASELTKRLAQHTETFMHGRLTPPPQEAYSLHRKLAGAFLMCIKLRAVVPCRDVLEAVHAKYVQEQKSQT
uniref:ABC1 atypical kinase-like domain-containing protein n=1 Tax=Globisporangium ultimum (strain ATCC 200006 / CBS 805.95 / DAOM BR144) TaxID=431595 RepID=K3WV13_GLOUD